MSFAKYFLCNLHYDSQFSNYSFFEYEMSFIFLETAIESKKNNKKKKNDKSVEKEFGVMMIIIEFRSINFAIVICMRHCIIMQIIDSYL